MSADAITNAALILLTAVVNGAFMFGAMKTRVERAEKTADRAHERIDDHIANQH